MFFSAFLNVESSGGGRKGGGRSYFGFLWVSCRRRYFPLSFHPPPPGLKKSCSYDALVCTSRYDLAQHGRQNENSTFLSSFPFFPPNSEQTARGTPSMVAPLLWSAPCWKEGERNNMKGRGLSWSNEATKEQSGHGWRRRSRRPPLP